MDQWLTMLYWGELHKPRKEPDIVMVSQAGGLRWLGRLSAMQEQNQAES